MATAITGLQEKIFLDRYAEKDSDVRNAKVGDTVMVTLDEGKKAHNVQKAAGIIKDSTADDLLVVELRDGREVTTERKNILIAKESHPEQMWDRLADSVSSVEVEEKRAFWRERFRKHLYDWGLVPGGRIMAGAGVSEELTLFNCYVLPNAGDSRGLIVDKLKEMTEVMARGGGVGINLSSLRPRKAVVHGVNGTSSGSVSWGGLFSFTTGLIEQGK